METKESSSSWGLIIVLVVVVIGIVAVGAFFLLDNEDSEEEDVSVTTVSVTAFQAAGEIGGGVLTAGAEFAPTGQNSATLTRGADWMEIDIQTSGLPPGAYTVWWVVFNNPSACADACGEADLLTEDVQASAFWATGGIIEEDGIGNFSARHELGTSRGVFGAQDILNAGAFDLATAEIHNAIKYHGAPSEDVNELVLQTHTLGGGCMEGANAIDIGEPFGIQCFDPQDIVYAEPS